MSIKVDNLINGTDALPFRPLTVEKAITAAT